ncbi:cytochrome P450 [Pseudonocardia spinosispora]|uniref:cytochrome P450 n=1 Tax=Pseudonocardia spinosispora TaxID=103441 RepID=UPI000687B7E1|nr:cytochrome P450 [Pseudonocardia spinosispora]
MVPLEIDPPEHAGYRTLLGKAFAPTLAPDRHRQSIRDAVNAMIDDAVEQGDFDACQVFAGPLPSFIATAVMGLPAEDAGLLQGWIHKIIHEAAIRPEAAVEAATEHHEYFSAQFARRREATAAGSEGDDVLTILLNSEVDGARLGEEELLGFCLLLLLASIDTTQKTIGSIFYHLAVEPGIREQLGRNPAGIPRAVEEFLRMWAPVQTSRIATAEAEVAGHRLQPGEPVLVSLLAANRDPGEFTSAGEFHANRSPNRHLAFGAHIHRCPGSHIARLELRILLEEVMRRIPDFELRDESAVEWTPGQTQGVTRVPLRLRPSTVPPDEAAHSSSASR